MRQVPLLILMCLGIIMSLICYANFPALQPEFEKLWGLSKLESGLIFGIFFGGMLAGTPIISPLADKIDPRRIWFLSTLLMALSSFCFAYFAEGFRSAMLFTAYGAHCWEAFTIGSWGVAFLTFHLTAFEPDLNPVLNPIRVATITGLIGLPASIIGNELCLRFGRRRVIFLISAVSAVVTSIFGFLLGMSYWFLVIMSGVETLLLTMD